MAWAFDVNGGVPRAYQSGTDSNLDALGTAITAVPVVARSTAVNTSMMRKPPTPTGFWYRCSTAGTTAATAPTYGTTDGGTTTDGTSVWTAFLAPVSVLGGTKPIYFMPAIRMEIAGTLTNANNQISTFTCRDILLSSASSNFTSGAWASDGVTPLYDGLHFTTTLITVNNVTPSIQVNAGTMTLIGGEVQTAAAVSISGGGAKVLSYYTRWRSTRVIGGVSSNRFRAYSSTSVFRGCELYDMSYDLFVMPAEFSVVARDAEYVAQYVGGDYGGVHAYFKASALQNPDGSYDFDNYSGGYVELFNCVKGANLNVTSQLPSNRHCVPLYQDVRITAKDTAGVAVQNVRFTATDAPDNSPTITITVAGNLKTWDFRSPLTYQTTSNASGIALSSPILKVWYYQGSLKQNLRFPASTVTFQGRAYGFKTLNVPVVLGSDTIQDVSAGMVAQDTAAILSESAALALTKFTFAPSGATGGTVTATSSFNANELWDYYQAWINQFANRSSNDTWTAIGGKLTMGNWTLVLNTGVTGSAGATVDFIKATTITLNGAAKMAMLYETSAGGSTIFEARNIKPGASYIVANNSTKATIQFGTNGEATAQDYPIYFPPGSAGTQIYVARQLHGDQFDFEVVTLEEGLIWYSFVDIPNEGIAETNLATVLGYTTIENYTKLYDRVCAHRTTEAGIKLGNIVIRAGTQLQFGSYSGVVNHNPPGGAVFSITGSTITIKASALDGTSRYNTIVATPPATWVGHTNEEINGEVEDANGDSSVNIQAAAISTFEIWKITDATPPDNYATGTLLDTVGIGKYRFIHVDGYKMVIRDTTTNFRVVSEMEKGTYTAELFFGASVQLAQAAEVSEINNKVDALQVDVTNLPLNVWAFIVETGHSALATLRLMASVLVGKVSGAGTGTEVFRDLGDTKDRVISSVDENGNRTNVTKDGT